MKIFVIFMYAQRADKGPEERFVCGYTTSMEKAIQIVADRSLKASRYRIQVERYSWMELPKIES